MTEHLIEGVNDFHDGNFWNSNPQMIYIPPFSLLYKRDESEDKEYSSKEMWGVFLYAENSHRSKFQFIEELEKKEILSEDFNLDFEDPLVQQCIEAYPIKSMTMASRALKDEEEFLMKRNKWLKEQNYSLETARDLDIVAKNSKQIYENFEKVKIAFMEESQKGMLKGDRKESKTETGDI